jgi:hypothetical protein
METNERNPLKWSDAYCANVLRILAAYIRKWSGSDSPRELSPDARDEIRSRILMDLMTGEIPDGVSPIHYVFRTARRWRSKGWNGDTQTNTERMRREAAAARKSLSDPGSEASEAARNKTPYRGSSVDSKSPTPLAMMIAAETVATVGIHYVSDRQAKARRRPVKGKATPTYRPRITGFAGRPRVGFGRNGRPLYFTGARTLLEWVAIPPSVEVAYNRKSLQWEHGPFHTGTLANRSIGKVKADPIGQNRIDEAWEAMTGGTSERMRFVPPATPTVGIPAVPGDGTEWRPIRD